MPAFLVHGNPDSARLWSRTVEHLGDYDGEIVAADLPGFADPAPDGFARTKESYVDWISARLEELDVFPTVPPAFALVSALLAFVELALAEFIGVAGAAVFVDAVGVVTGGAVAGCCRFGCTVNGGGAAGNSRRDLKTNK